jgi:outer membrane protein assembly factor BamE (lipoprotein component of BamABCDE complex)
LTLFYSGLEITLLGDGEGRNLDVYTIKVTSKKWQASGISIGADKHEVQTKFGEPYSKAEKSGETVFYYVTKDNIGGVNFHFQNGKLVRIAMTETLC